MNKRKFEIVFINAVNSLRKSGIVPIDTGNLAYNAIRGLWVSDKHFKVYIDETVADYAKYTIEPWGNGQNPNENWFERAFKFLANDIARQLGGKIG